MKSRDEERREKRGKLSRFIWIPLPLFLVTEEKGQRDWGFGAEAHQVNVKARSRGRGKNNDKTKGFSLSARSAKSTTDKPVIRIQSTINKSCLMIIIQRIRWEWIAFIPLFLTSFFIFQVTSISFCFWYKSLERQSSLCSKNYMIVGLLTDPHYFSYPVVFWH